YHASIARSVTEAGRPIAGVKSARPRAALRFFAPPAVRGTGVTEHPPEDRYSGLMLAARITLPHFSVSSAMSLPKSATEPGSAVAPHSASRAFILGSARAALISVLSLLMISASVAFGAPRPYQILPS